MRLRVPSPSPSVSLRFRDLHGQVIALPGVSSFFPALGPLHAGLRHTGECRTRFSHIRSHAAMLYVVDNEQARTTRPLAPGGARARISMRQRGSLANRAGSRDATLGRRQHAECKRVGYKRPRILGKLLIAFPCGQGVAQQEFPHFSCAWPLTRRPATHRRVPHSLFAHPVARSHAVCC